MCAGRSGPAGGQARLCICLEGVEQAFYLWLNGQFIGYSEDSFTPPISI